MNYTPYVPEKMVTVEISTTEMELLTSLRKVFYGEVSIFKIDGKLVRVETKISKLLGQGVRVNES